MPQAQRLASRRPRHPYLVQAIAIKETTTIKAEMEDLKATATRVRRQYDEAEEAHTKHLDKLRVCRGGPWLELRFEGKAAVDKAFVRVLRSMVTK